MREILFKAKRIDTGEWVEGYYFCMVHDDGRHVHHFIMPLGSDLSLGTPIEKIQVEIDINTLCQYTGLTDKNGNKIWENDVVKDKDGDIYKCVWDSGNCEYMLVNESESYGIGYRIGSDYEVIGNIFDNPELIKAGGVNE